MEASSRRPTRLTHIRTFGLSATDETYDEAVEFTKSISRHVERLRMRVYWMPNVRQMISIIQTSGKFRNLISLDVNFSWAADGWAVHALDMLEHLPHIRHLIWTGDYGWYTQGISDGAVREREDRRIADSEQTMEPCEHRDVARELTAGGSSTGVALPCTLDNLQSLSIFGSGCLVSVREVIRRAPTLTRLRLAHQYIDDRPVNETPGDAKGIRKFGPVLQHESIRHVEMFLQFRHHMNPRGFKILEPDWWPNLESLYISAALGPTCFSDHATLRQLGVFLEDEDDFDHHAGSLPSSQVTGTVAPFIVAGLTMMPELIRLSTRIGPFPNNGEDEDRRDLKGDGGIRFRTYGSGDGMLVHARYKRTAKLDHLFLPHSTDYKWMDMTRDGVAELAALEGSEVSDDTESSEDIDDSHGPYDDRYDPYNSDDPEGLYGSTNSEYSDQSEEADSDDSSAGHMRHSVQDVVGRNVRAGTAPQESDGSRGRDSWTSTTFADDPADSDEEDDTDLGWIDMTSLSGWPLPKCLLDYVYAVLGQDREWVDGARGLELPSEVWEMLNGWKEMVEWNEV